VNQRGGKQARGRMSQGAKEPRGEQAMGRTGKGAKKPDTCGTEGQLVLQHCTTLKASHITNNLGQM